MAIDINLIKQLRELTKAPLGDCKSALEESEWDVNNAQEILRKKWVLKANKKLDRETNFGIVKFNIKWDYVVWVKILCETDFVAKNEMFQKLVDETIDRLFFVDWDFETDSLNADIKNWIQSFINEHVATIWESLQLTYAFKKKIKAFAYNHTTWALSAVVFYDSETDVSSGVKDVALQIAAMNPAYLDLSSIPLELWNEKKEEFSKDPSLNSKPEDIRSKIVDGKLQKEFADETLMEQVSIKDNTKKIKDIIWNDFNIIGFMRETIG